MKKIENKKIFENFFKIFIETLKNHENLKDKQLKNQIFHVLTWYLAELYIGWKKRNSFNNNQNNKNKEEKNNSSWLFDITIEKDWIEKYIDVKVGRYKFYNDNEEKLFFIQLWQIIKGIIYILDKKNIKWFEEFKNNNFTNILTKNSIVNTETWIKLFWKFIKKLFDLYKKDHKFLDIFKNYYKYIVILDGYRYKNIDDLKFDKKIYEYNNKIKEIKKQEENFYIANFKNKNNEYIVFDNKEYYIRNKEYKNELFSEKQKTYVISIQDEQNKKSEIIISFYGRNWEYKFFIWCHENILDIFKKQIVWTFIFSFKQFLKNLFVLMNKMKIDDEGKYMIEIFKNVVKNIKEKKWKKYIWNQDFELTYYWPCITAKENANSENKDYIYVSAFWNEKIWNFVVWFIKKQKI